MKCSVELALIYLFESHTRTVHTGSYCEVEGLCFWVAVRPLVGDKSERAAIVEDAYELNSFITTATEVSIEGVHMLCPPSITGRQHWSMEELLKIVVHRGIASSDGAVVYETAVATYKLGDLDLRLRKRSHVLYSSQLLATRDPEMATSPRSVEAPQLYARFGYGSARIPQSRTSQTKRCMMHTDCAAHAMALNVNVAGG